MRYYISKRDLKDVLDGGISELYTKDSEGYHWTRHTIEVD